MQKQSQKQDERSTLHSKFAPFYMLSGAVPLLLLNVVLLLAATHVVGSQAFLLWIRLIGYVGMPWSAVSCLVGVGPLHPWTHNWITPSVQATIMRGIATFAPALLTLGSGVIEIFEGLSATQFGPTLSGVFILICSGFLFYRAWKKFPSGE